VKLECYIGKFNDCVNSNRGFERELAHRLTRAMLTADFISEWRAIDLAHTE
jgi:hypothetical protein